MRTSPIVVVCVVLALLLLASCRSSDDVVGKKLPGDGGASADASTAPAGGAKDAAGGDSSSSSATSPASASNETKAAPKSDSTASVKPAEPDLAEVANVTEAPKYDLKNQCTADKLGVVRIFDEEGKKKVFRPFCDAATKSVVTFSCVDGVARPTSKSCPFDCYISPDNGLAACRTTALPPHTPPKVTN